MRPELDSEWSQWSEAWQEQPRANPELRAELIERVRRQGRWLWVRAVLEGVFAVVMLAGSAVIAAYDRSAPTLVWALAIWCFTAVAWRWSLWHRRSLWKLDAPGVRGFVELSRARLVYSLRAVRFGGQLLAAELAFIFGWCMWRWRSDAVEVERQLERYVTVLGLTAVFSAGVVAWIVHTRRSATRELHALDALKKDLDLT